MTATPTQCPKCAGHLLGFDLLEQEPYCLCCGWRPPPQEILGLTDRFCNLNRQYHPTTKGMEA